MKKLIFFVFLFLTSFEALAYSTIQQAYSACMTAKGSSPQYGCINQDSQQRINLTFLGDGSYLNNFSYDTGCSAGFSWSNTTGSCQTSCPSAGTKKSLGVHQGSVITAPENPVGGMQIEINDESSLAVSDGVQYSYTALDYQGVSYVENNTVYSVYEGTSTGVCGLTENNSQTAPIGTPTNPINASQNGKCKTDTHGNTVCDTNDKANLKCGSVNGAEICIDTTTGTGTVNGQAVQSSDHNCGYVNGKAVCVASDATSTTTAGCVQSGGVRKCANSDLINTTQSTTVNNQNGSTTTTTIHENNIIGSGPVTTSTTTDGNGNQTTTTTGDGNGTGNGNGNGTGDGYGGDCVKFPDSLGCQNVKNDSQFTPEENLEQGEVNLSYTPVSMSGGGASCPAPESISTFGRTYSLSYQPVCDFALGIKPVVLVMAAVAAAYIVFKGA